MPCRRRGTASRGAGMSDAVGGASPALRDSLRPTGFASTPSEGQPGYRPKAEIRGPHPEGKPIPGFRCAPSRLHRNNGHGRKPGPVARIQAEGRNPGITAPGETPPPDSATLYPGYTRSPNAGRRSKQRLVHRRTGTESAKRAAMRSVPSWGKTATPRFGCARAHKLQATCPTSSRIASPVRGWPRGLRQPGSPLATATRLCLATEASTAIPGIQYFHRQAREILVVAGDQCQIAGNGRDR